MYNNYTIEGMKYYIFFISILTTVKPPINEYSISRIEHLNRIDSIPCRECNTFFFN